jgi:hypothetical protein
MKVIGCRVAVMSSKTRRTMAKEKKKGSKSYNAWIKPIVEFLLISCLISLVSSLTLGFLKGAILCPQDYLTGIHPSRPSTAQYACTLRKRRWLRPVQSDG